MAKGYVPDDVRELWEEFSPEPYRISSDELRENADRLRNRALRRRVFGLLGLLGFGLASAAIFIAVPSWLAGGGCLFCIAGASYFAPQFWHLTPGTIPHNTGSTPSLVLYRAELERQLRSHRWAKFWPRFLLLLPGPPLVLLGIAEISSRPAASVLVTSAIAFVLLCCLAIGINAKYIRHYRRLVEAATIASRSKEKLATATRRSFNDLFGLAVFLRLLSEFDSTPERRSTVRVPH